ncbi:MAG: sel1 repeat family protein [Telluria sp.]
MSHALRIAVFCLAVAIGGSATADELADANQALQQKNYPVALKLFGKLAGASNSEAQLRLGEMYWYGEGVALDRAKADALFAQAAASGNPAAVAATKLSARRATQAGNIALWTGGYNGAELRAGKFDCKAPALPANRSTANEEIQRVTADIGAWTACYNGFVANVASLMPPGKAIPGDVLEVMSEQELALARAHLDKVYKRVVAGVKADTTSFIALRDKWESDTAAYVLAKNEKIKQDTLAHKREVERTHASRMEGNTRGEMTPRIAPSR